MLLRVHVIANSSVSRVEGFYGGLKVKVRAKPLHGEANEEVLEVLAEHFRVPRKSVRIVNGYNSRNKIVEVIK